MRNNVSFIMTDSEINTEDFFESINSMFVTREIAGLILRKTETCLLLKLSKCRRKNLDPKEKTHVYFINRVRDCLHLIFALSHVNS